ncbi:MAG: 50S ribosomal protein L15 [Gemmatimonadota bacterium]
MAEKQRLGLDNLAPAAGSRPPRKRVGRGPGSGSGKTSGKGHKGQKSRAGESIPAWFEGGQMPLHRRTPKRGFSPPRRREYEILNLWDLAGLDSPEITPELLRARGLVSGRRPIKILADGELDRALIVKAHAFSTAAREKIEAAGGRPELVEG